MDNLKKRGKSVPLKIWLVALVKWFVILICYVPMWLLNYPMSLIVATVTRPMSNVFGETAMTHSQKYIDLGASGIWEYWGTNIPILKWFSVYEDGVLGETSGRWSASVKGQERKWINRVRYLIRNPFNYGKRTSALFACFVNDCTVTYYGDYIVNDRGTQSYGSYMCVAKHNKTKRTYYGYRAVFTWEDFFRKLGIKTPKFLSDKFCNVSLGFKIKPSHADNIQDEDDLDKSFTFRIQFARKLEKA